jgi:HAD superfamily hydrolase (TIGR01549 family)
MQSKKVIAFDFDGVLINTVEMSFAINQMMRPEMSREEFLARHEGNVITAFADHIVDSYAKFFGEYRRQVRSHEITADFVKIIQALQSNYILAIVSATPTGVIHECLERAGLTQTFAHVLGGDFHADKAHKLQFLAKEYAVLPERMLFITDTLGDLREAKQARVPALAVSWGFHTAKTLSKGEPLKILNRPSELLAAIEELS